METDKITIRDAVTKYLETVKYARSSNTHHTYKNGVLFFLETLAAHSINVDTLAVNELSEDSIAWFTADLKNHAPTTERLYLTSITGFFEFLAAENLSQINLPRIRLLIRQRARRPGQRLPQFPASDIEKILSEIGKIDQVHLSEDERLRNLRDKAFLFTLADTGLRVHEACNLRRGDIDWNEGRALVIGKGNRQDVIRISQRALQEIKSYLQARAPLDGKTGRGLSSLPIFARHDKGTGSKIQPITTTTGRNIVSDRVREILGEEAVGTITPHSFRHYFVTCVLKGSGNLKLAQELARHRNISVTQRYAHLSNDELDMGYWTIFDKDSK